MTKPEHLKSYVDVAAEQVAGHGAVFICLDSDDDCVARIGPQILTVARSLRDDATFIVYASVREFESIFIAAASSLGFKADCQHDVRDAKGAISRGLQIHYSPTIDQARLVQAMNLDDAMSVPHFARLAKKVSALEVDGLRS